MALICRHEIKSVSLKEMNSPRGTAKFLGSMTLDSNETATKFTGERAIQRVMISLSGYASEIIFSDGVANIGGDDLTIASELTEELLKDEQFRSWVSTLPNPTSTALEVIEDPLVRAYIDRKIHECVRTLEPLKPAIQMISGELLVKEELTGDEVANLLDLAIRQIRTAALEPQF